MDRRLPPQPGEWIDRGRPLSFRFEGDTFQGLAGDVLSSALWANDLRAQGRSFKYHRPRGIYSLCEHDANVIVSGGRAANLRGDTLPLAEGLDVKAVNTLGGLEKDRLRITERFSKFLPVGFYYKAFHTPRRLFRFYENQMRKVAGLGKINPDHRSTPSPKDYAFCDLAVIGAGPAGLAGAVAAAEQGLKVLVVDEQPRPGGSFCWQWASDSHAQRRLAELLQQAQSLENLEIRCGAQAGGYYADHWLALFDQKKLTKLRAKALLAATGCFEQPAVFQNNDLPGVMLASAAQRLIHLYAVKPFDRAVVFAANADGYRMALELLQAGVDVAAVVDPRSQGEASELAQQLADSNIEILNGHAVFEAIASSGKKRIEGALIGVLESSDSPRRLDCDGIAVSMGWAPNASLIYQAGGRLNYAEHVEQFTPSELPPGVFAAGRVAGVFDLESQIADGHRAGLAAAAHLGRFHGPLPDRPSHQGSSPSYRFPIFRAGQSGQNHKSFVDFDEDLHLADFHHAHLEGYDNIELLKRYTTVGMGPSQGKLANMNAVRILAQLNGATIDQTGTTTSRPFHQPVPIAHLAGRRFHPFRCTPLHAWHVQAGAEMIHAGAWRRPEYYQIEGYNRKACILQEAQHVRQHVGLIDLGTLGKLQVSGPDAVRFLEIIYTGRFAKLPIGRIRYAVACDETGVIIEDGVVARLAEDCFYVTATSSGAAAFYREMQRWAILLKMDVVLVNATGQLTAFNIAGPRSRQVLQGLTSIDLSQDALPYLGVRQGVVAGAPAMVMRVGFVGELGYEIHTPASCGWHVWESLMQAGGESGPETGIRPFGVEAQRLLRLEKGHLIVGQDTDALTNPFEADVAWAIGKNKPFFIGSRCLELLRKKPLTRRLVGLAFSSAAQQTASLPEECHLIISQGEIAGRITSIAHQSTLGHPIALALVRPDLTEPGTSVEVRVADGSLVQAEVTTLPFYDPENKRQQ